jgi:hypothetical protein
MSPIRPVPIIPKRSIAPLPYIRFEDSLSKKPLLNNAGFVQIGIAALMCSREK